MIFYDIAKYIIIFVIFIVLLKILYDMIFTKKDKITKSNYYKRYLRKNKNPNKNIVDLLKSNSIKHPNKTALRYKINDKWLGITYKEYYDNVVNVAESLNHWIGAESRVAIIGFNHYYWFYSHLGCMMNKGISIGMYPTSNSETCGYICNESKVDILIVEDEAQLSKFINLKIPSLKYIVYYTDITNDEILTKFSVPIMSINKFMEFTKPLTHDNEIDINDVATIIYTSGTTGSPKGAIIRHYAIMNVLYNMVKMIHENSSLVLDYNERFISYLPLNHIAGQIMDIYVPIFIYGTVWFADKDAFKSSLSKTILETKPTIFIGVPRVWEKIMENIEENIKNRGIIGTFSKIFLKSKIIEKIGLDECKCCITASAPLTETTRNYFTNLGLVLYDIYGMTETTGPITMSLPNVYAYGSVGKPIVPVKISKNKEILVKGNTLFSGYYLKEEETEKAYSKKWFKTGDLGYIDNNGFLFITGREKELIITSGGENIAPLPIEDAIKQKLPFIDYVVLIGDKRKFLSVLLVSKSFNDIIKTVQDIDNSIHTYNDFSKSVKIKKFIDTQIDEVNKNAPSNANKVQKWLLFDKYEFNIGFELTPTLKVRRNYINDKYKEKIDKLYN